MPHKHHVVGSSPMEKGTIRFVVLLGFDLCIAVYMHCGIIICKFAIIIVCVHVCVHICTYVL